jgi:hypothetical protein
MGAPFGVRGNMTERRGSGNKEAREYQAGGGGEAVGASLTRNMDILKKLGCLDVAGMEKLKRGNAPTITRGPYAGQIATVDHIIPRSVCPELDNRLYNLEFMPDKLNGSKGNKIGARQLSLAHQWHASGLLSEAALAAVVRSAGTP